jgi:hypothetical protein
MLAAAGGHTAAVKALVDANADLHQLTPVRVVGDWEA